MNNTILTGQAAMNNIDQQRHQEIKALQSNPIHTAAKVLDLNCREAGRNSTTTAAAFIARYALTSADKVRAELGKIDTYA
jgi:hypothetical protein